MTAFWVLLYLTILMVGCVALPLYRISDAMETKNRWAMKHWEALAEIRDTLRDIKRLT